MKYLWYNFRLGTIPDWQPSLVYHEENAKKISKDPWPHPSTWPYIFSLNRPTACCIIYYTDELNVGVLTKVVPIHVKGTYNHSNRSSRLLCPPQIQLEAIRTGAVLTRKMNIYKEGVLTKVVSNHVNETTKCSDWLSRLLCPPQIQLEAIRMGEVLTRKINI